MSPLSTPIDMCVVSPNFTHLRELRSHRVSDSLPLVTSSKSHTTQLCDDLCHLPESPVPVREPDYRKDTQNTGHEESHASSSKLLRTKQGDYQVSLLNLLAYEEKLGLGN